MVSAPQDFHDLVSLEMQIMKKAPGQGVGIQSLGLAWNHGIKSWDYHGMSWDISYDHGFIMGFNVLTNIGFSLDVDNII